MKETLLSLTGDALFLCALVSVFLSFACLTYGLSTASQRFMASYKATFTESASANMSDMFLFVDVTRLFYMNLAAIAVLPALVWLLTGDPFSALVVFGVLVVLPGMLYRRMRKQRLKRFEMQMPDSLMMVSGAMRAGASLNIALEGLVKEQPAPISQEFELFLREQRLGLEFDKSLDNMEKRLPIPDFSMLVAALKISREVGGNLAEVLESLGETLRRKQMMEGKIESLTAQGKLQGIVMTLLPVLLAFLLYFLEPEAMSKLWTDPIGWIVLGVIIFMLTIGYLLIRKITSIDV
jgi:tight adherence protein B